MGLITRRAFNKVAATVTAAAAVPALYRPARAAVAAKIVIIGGGPGGASVAYRLIAANPALDITLIEAKETYTTCFYSNLFIGGFRSFQ